MPIRMVTAVLAAALLGAWAPDAAAPAQARAARKCAHGHVLVKVNKRSRCRRLGAVLPRPKRGDVRLAYIRAALNLDASKLKHRHGKHPRSLRHGFGRLGRKARKAFLRALPRVLKLIDRLPPRAATARTRCGGPGSVQPVSEAGDTNGLSVQGLQGPNGETGGTMTYTLNGQAVETTFITCRPDIYSVPACPAANGDVDTSSSRSYLETTTRVVEGRTLVFSQSTSMHVKDTLHGKVAGDARLDYLDFKHVEETLIVATGAFAERSDSTQVTRVNMRTGSYDAAHSSVTITGNPDRLPRESFAAAVERAISAYREAEVGSNSYHPDGWSTFDRKGKGGYCATAVFSRASDTLKLRKDATGQVSMFAKAQDGGKAAGARWTRLGQTNASFSPASAVAPEPSVHYTVTAAPAGGHVELTLSFTSTAGVGKAVWRQATEDDALALYTGRVTGSMDITHSPDFCPSQTHLDYTANLAAAGGSTDPFPVAMAADASDYGADGSGTFVAPPCEEIDDPGCSTGLAIDPEALQGQAQFRVSGATVNVSLESPTYTPTTDACAGLLETRSFLHGTFALSRAHDPTITVALSENEDTGVVRRTGSGTLTLRRVN